MGRRISWPLSPHSGCRFGPYMALKYYGFWRSMVHTEFQPLLELCVQSRYPSDKKNPGSSEGDHGSDSSGSRRSGARCMILLAGTVRDRCRGPRAGGVGERDGGV